mgnify:CR=1 FL=1
MTKRGFANASVSTGSEHMVLEREKMPPKKRLLVVEEDEGEEIRLGPKKTPAASVSTSNSNVTRIMPSDDSAPPKKSPLI